MPLNVSDALGPPQPSGIPLGLVWSKDFILRQRSSVDEKVPVVIFDGISHDLRSRKLSGTRQSITTLQKLRSIQAMIADSPKASDLVPN